MKRKSFDLVWYYKIAAISLFGFFAIAIFLVRSATIPGFYGVVSAELPVISIPVEDRDAAPEAPDSSASTITSKTPVVVVTEDEIFFGDVAAFSSDLYSVDNKFLIKHKDGAPDLFSLARDMKKWMIQKQNTEKRLFGNIVVLMPAKSIPMPIVIQMIAELKRSFPFERVVLGGGIL
jgi:hypothetical protein